MVLGQPRAQREAPEEAVRVEYAALIAVDLPPDRVEEGDVVGRRTAEVEVEAARHELVLEGRVQGVERHRPPGSESPVADCKPPVSARMNLAEQEMHEHWREEDRVLLRDHREAVRQP